MKTLIAVQFGANSVLNREQLKKVLGGTVKPPAECTNSCNMPGDCPSGSVCVSVPCQDNPAFIHIICSPAAA